MLFSNKGDCRLCTVKLSRQVFEVCWKEYISFGNIHGSVELHVINLDQNRQMKHYIIHKQEIQHKIYSQYFFL